MLDAGIPAASPHVDTPAADPVADPVANPPTTSPARCVTPMACQRTDNLVGVDLLSLVVRVLAFAALTVRFAMCVLGGV